MLNKFTSILCVWLSMTVVAFLFQNCAQEPFDREAAYGLSSQAAIDQPIAGSTNVTLSFKTQLNQPIDDGAPVTLQTDAVTSGIGVRYDWYVRTILGSPTLVGTTLTSEYAFNMSSSYVGYMYVVVTFPDQTTKESPLFPLSMQQDLTSAPSISSEIPVDSVFNRNVGDSLSFSVSAMGNPSPAYVWQKASASSGWLDLNITSAVLNLNNLTLADSGSYRLRVYNSQGEAFSKTFAVTVQQATQPLTISSSPQNVTADEGGTASFSVQAALGSGNYSYNWIKVGSNSSIGSSSQLSINNLAVSHGGTYRVTVTDTGTNESLSRDATLTVNAAPSLNLSIASFNSNPANGELQFSIGAFSGYDSTSQYCFNFNPGPIGAFSNQNCITYYYNHGTLTVNVRDGQAPYTYKFIQTHDYAYSSSLRRIAPRVIPAKVVKTQTSSSTSNSFIVVPRLNYQNTAGVYAGWGQYKVEVTDSSGTVVTSGSKLMKYCATNFQTGALTCY